MAVIIHLPLTREELLILSNSLRSNKLLWPDETTLGLKVEALLEELRQREKHR